MNSLNPVSVQSVHAACKSLEGNVLRTPLVQLQNEGSQAEIFLKLESLQPTGSFKVRGAGNALLSIDPSQLKHGVWTASAGNMGQALAWFAQRLGVSCSVIVPDDAPEVKLNAIQKLQAKVVKVPFADYQSIQRKGMYPGMVGQIIHPFADEAVMAGNGMIGMEILDELPNVDRILVPYGGGGLICGIASFVKASRGNVRVEAVELETATPLQASLAAGRSVEVPYRASFVSGMGAPFVFPQIWPLARRLVDGVRVVTLVQVVEAIRLLAEKHHILVEGAGAVALAAALAYPAGRQVVCVVSGGNINPGHLDKILRGEMP